MKNVNFDFFSSTNIFFEFFPIEKSMKNENFDFFLRPTFFSKKIPMEKSLKNENFDFSKKSNTRRGFTVKHCGENGELFSRTLEGRSSSHPSLE